MDSINYYPVLMTWKENKAGLSPIGIRVDFNGKKVGIEMIRQSAAAADWNGETRRLSAKTHTATLINAIIEKKLSHYRDFILRRQAFDLPLSSEIIKRFMQGGVAGNDFYGYAEFVLDNKKLKDGKPLSDEAKRRYRDEIKRMMKFRETLSFSQITVSFLTEYKAWMLNVYQKRDGSKMEKNGIWKALSFIRMIYNYAKDNDGLQGDSPFKQFSVGTCEENPEKIKYLELQHLEAIEETLINKKDQLEDITYRIGWRFLCMCVFGFRISDAMRLDDTFVNDIGEICFTPYKTRRNGNQATIPVTSPRQARYLKMTMANPLPGRDHKSFRTTFNNHLKVLAAIAGVNPKITSHVGRHTMGSFLVDADVKDKAGMAILGLKSDKTLKVYQHLKQNKLQAEANKLNGVM